MPFGQHSRFFNDTDGPCGRCGAPSPGWDGQHTCRRVLPGRWPFGRAIWLNRDGVRVDVPVSGRDEPDEASQSTRPLTPKTPDSAGDHVS